MCKKKTVWSNFLSSVQIFCVQTCCITFACFCITQARWGSEGWHVLAVAASQAPCFLLALFWIFAVEILFCLFSLPVNEGLTFFFIVWIIRIYLLPGLIRIIQLFVHYPASELLHCSASKLFHLSFLLNVPPWLYFFRSSPSYLVGDIYMYSLELQLWQVQSHKLHLGFLSPSSTLQSLGC